MLDLLGRVPHNRVPGSTEFQGHPVMQPNLTCATTRYRGSGSVPQQTRQSEGQRQQWKQSKASPPISIHGKSTEKSLQSSSNLNLQENKPISSPLSQSTFYNHADKWKCISHKSPNIWSWMTDVSLSWFFCTRCMFLHVNPHSEMKPVWAHVLGCLIAEVQSNLQITSSLHCSSRGTLKPVLQVGSQAECLSGHKITRRDKTTCSCYGQQYL